jgi:hypothetical protein
MYNEDKLNSVIKSVADNELLTMQEFAFDNLVDLWEQWKNIEIEDGIREELIRMSYSDFLERAKTDEKVKKIKDLIFKIVAYCDENANDKEHLNEYSDKRVLAKCGIRQNAWAIQLLKYKRNPEEVTDAIKNVILYIENPEQRFPIISEKHRKLIYRFFIGENEYQKERFDEVLFSFFDAKCGFEFSNDTNKTKLYSKIIYEMKDDWKENLPIKGVYVYDGNENWKQDRIKENYSCFYWNKNFVNSHRVYPELEKLLEEEGYFWFYFASGNKANYRARIIDMATSEESYENKLYDWKDKSPFGLCEKFTDYEDKVKVILLVDKFEKLAEPIDINCFVPYQASPIRQNNVVAYSRIKNQTSIKMDNFIAEITGILKKKKNIILQGAPGTGKTYHTAAIALSILGYETSGKTHAEIMTDYDSLLKKQIFFTTFHQSMDYEDFIEGIKPKLEGGGIVYDVERGILKEAIHTSPDEPKVIIIDEINRGNISKIFGELITLIEADKRIRSNAENNHHLSVILPYSKDEFGVPANVYFIGTMNTTDRSTGTIDYALRRRFAFITLPSREEVLDEIKNIPTRDLAKQKFKDVHQFISNNKVTDYEIDDLMVGHSYFLAESIPDLKIKLKYEVLPLLKEYMKDGIIRNSDETKKFIKNFIE